MSAMHKAAHTISCPLPHRFTATASFGGGGKPCFCCFHALLVLPLFNYFITCLLRCVSGLFSETWRFVRMGGLYDVF